MSHDGDGMAWLTLVYQFPQGPGSLRVKIWRRLQTIGAVAIKNSLYVLPLNEQSQEDFEWVLTELTSGGADGAILVSRFVDGMTDQQVQALFDTARNNDYAQLVDEIQTSIANLSPGGQPDEDTVREARRVLARARKRLAEVEAIDFFGADGHDLTEAAMRALSERISMDGSDSRESDESVADTDLKKLKQRIWVTRRNVRVDRIASAWLIRRWIDPDAAFKFVSSKAYTPAGREVRFDMFEAEFTHEGNKCTFEVLARRIAPDDGALRNVAEIVHDIDLKDGKFGHPETQGIANVLAGIVSRIEDDEGRIERGGELFEDLYGFFSEATT